MKPLNPFCFMFNSLAMGDMVASVPVVKWAAENIYHEDPSDYIVVANEAFRPLFPFVPDANWRDFEKKENSWGVPAHFAMSTLNQKRELITRNTPKHMHLGQFASIKMLDRILSYNELQYVPLKLVSLAKFDLDPKYVVFVSTYRDETRAWHAKHLLETASWVQGQGYEPVFIGKTDIDAQVIKTSLPVRIGFGYDLRNKTTVAELASILGQAKAVVGLDSGPIHLAGTTNTPIVCGYTSVSPEFRVPIRPISDTQAIVPELPCIGCESKWSSHFHDFSKCYLTHTQCCELMTSDKFIECLKRVL